MEDGQLLLCEELTLTQINCHLPSKPLSGSCKPGTDFKVPEQLPQMNSAKAIVVQAERQITGVFQRALSPEPPLVFSLKASLGTVDGLRGKNTQAVETE